MLAHNSLHPIARAIAALAPTMSPPANAMQVTEIAGQGVQATLADGSCYRLGQVDFVQALHGNELAPIHSTDSIAVLGDAHGWLALFHLQDQVREDAAQLLAQLQQDGKQVWILSGDRKSAVASLAAELGVPAAQAQGQLPPAEKYQIVQGLQQQGAKVVVVGDGMNDGPVLSLADVSCAMGQGAPITQARSDVLLLSSKLSDFGYAWRGAQLALRLIRQNLWWALAYNLLAIPAAVLGLLAPWHAALGMSLSSLLVVLNSLRMLRADNAFSEKE